MSIESDEAFGIGGKCLLFVVPYLSGSVCNFLSVGAKRKVGDREKVRRDGFN